MVWRTWLSIRQFSKEDWEAQVILIFSFIKSMARIFFKPSTNADKLKSYQYIDSTCLHQHNRSKRTKHTQQKLKSESAVSLVAKRRCLAWISYFSQSCKIIMFFLCLCYKLYVYCTVMCCWTIAVFWKTSTTALCTKKNSGVFLYLRKVDQALVLLTVFIITWFSCHRMRLLKTSLSGIFREGLGFQHTFGLIQSSYSEFNVKNLKILKHLGSFNLFPINVHMFKIIFSMYTR